MTAQDDHQASGQTPLTAVTAPDPYPYYATLVDRSPMYFDEPLRLWIASSANAVEACLANEALVVRPPAEPVPQSVAGTPIGDVFARFARMTDGPYHARVSGALRATFERLDWHAVENTAAHCSERLSANAFGDAGAYERYAHTLPVAVLASLLGMNDDGLSGAASQTRDFILALAPTASAEQVAHGVRAAETLARDVDANGVLLRMLREEAQRADVDEASTIANAIGFLFQSYDATAGLIGNTLVTLARMQSIDAPLESTVHEVARYDSPVQNTRRFAASDATILGHTVRAGDAVLVVLAAANRDPAVNPDPNRFDPRRANPRSYTFGLGGHRCPGVRTAYAIATAGVSALVQRGLDPRETAVQGYRALPNVRDPLLALARR